MNINYFGHFILTKDRRKSVEVSDVRKSVVNRTPISKLRLKRRIVEVQFEKSPEIAKNNINEVHNLKESIEISKGNQITEDVEIKEKFAENSSIIIENCIKENEIQVKESSIQKNQLINYTDFDLNFKNCQTDDKLHEKNLIAEKSQNNCTEIETQQQETQKNNTDAKTIEGQKNENNKTVNRHDCNTTENIDIENKEREEQEIRKKKDVTKEKDIYVTDNVCNEESEEPIEKQKEGNNEECENLNKNFTDGNEAKKEIKIAVNKENETNKISSKDEENILNSGQELNYMTETMEKEKNNQQEVTNKKKQLSSESKVEKECLKDKCIENNLETEILCNEETNKKVKEPEEFNRKGENLNESFIDKSKTIKKVKKNSPTGKKFENDEIKKKLEQELITTHNEKTNETTKEDRNEEQKVTHEKECVKKRLNTKKNKSYEESSKEECIKNILKELKLKMGCLRNKPIVMLESEHFECKTEIEEGEQQIQISGKNDEKNGNITNEKKKKKHDYLENNMNKKQKLEQKHSENIIIKERQKTFQQVFEEIVNTSKNNKNENNKNIDFEEQLNTELKNRKNEKINENVNTRSEELQLTENLNQNIQIESTVKVNNKNVKKTPKKKKNGKKYNLEKHLSEEESEFETENVKDDIEKELEKMFSQKINTSSGEIINSEIGKKDLKKYENHNTQKENVEINMEELKKTVKKKKNNNLEEHLILEEAENSKKNTRNNEECTKKKLDNEKGSKKIKTLIELITDELEISNEENKSVQIENNTVNNTKECEIKYLNSENNDILAQSTPKKKKEKKKKNDANLEEYLIQEESEHLEKGIENIKEHTKEKLDNIFSEKRIENEITVNINKNIVEELEITEKNTQIENIIETKVKESETIFDKEDENSDLLSLKKKKNFKNKNNENCNVKGKLSQEDTENLKENTESMEDQTMGQLENSFSKKGNKIRKNSGNVNKNYRENLEPSEGNTQFENIITINPEELDRSSKKEMNSKSENYNLKKHLSQEKSENLFKTTENNDEDIEEVLEKVSRMRKKNKNMENLNNIIAEELEITERNTVTENVIEINPGKKKKSPKKENIDNYNLEQLDQEETENLSNNTENNEYAKRELETSFSEKDSKKRKKNKSRENLNNIKEEIEITETNIQVENVTAVNLEELSRSPKKEKKSKNCNLEHLNNEENENLFKNTENIEESAEIELDCSLKCKKNKNKKSKKTNEIISEELEITTSENQNVQIQTDSEELDKIPKKSKKSKKKKEENYDLEKNSNEEGIENIKKRKLEFNFSETKSKKKKKKKNPENTNESVNEELEISERNAQIENITEINVEELEKNSKKKKKSKKKKDKEGTRNMENVIEEELEITEKTNKAKKHKKKKNAEISGIDNTISEIHLEELLNKVVKNIIKETKRKVKDLDTENSDEEPSKKKKKANKEAKNYNEIEKNNEVLQPKHKHKKHKTKENLEIENISENQTDEEFDNVPRKKRKKREVYLEAENITQIQTDNEESPHKKKKKKKCESEAENVYENQISKELTENKSKKKKRMKQEPETENLNQSQINKKLYVIVENVMNKKNKSSGNELLQEEPKELISKKKDKHKHKSEENLKVENSNNSRDNEFCSEKKGKNKNKNAIESEKEENSEGITKKHKSKESEKQKHKMEEESYSKSVNIQDKGKNSESHNLNKGSIIHELLNKRRELIDLKIQEERTKRRRKLTDTESLEIGSDEDINELLEKAIENELLNDSQVSLLDRLVVVLPWPVPPLHQIKTNIGTRPTKEQYSKLQELNVPIKKGMYTKKEDETIKDNFQYFCKMHDIDYDPTPFLKFRHKNCRSLSTVHRLNFVRFLAHNLNDRLLASVYQRFRRLYSNFNKRGRFSPKEDKVIIDYMLYSNSKEPHKDLSRILNRDSKSTRDRYGILLKTEEESKPVKWTPEHVNYFIDRLLEVTNCKSADDLLKLVITRSLWKKVGEKLNMPIDKLRRLWKFNVKPRISIKETMPMNEVKAELFKILYEKNLDDYREIDWEKIAQRFYGLTGDMLNKLFRDLVRYKVPEALRSDLKETLNYLKNEKFNKKSMRNTKYKKIEVDIKTTDDFL